MIMHPSINPKQESDQEWIPKRGAFMLATSGADMHSLRLRRLLRMMSSGCLWQTSQERGVSLAQKETHIGGVIRAELALLWRSECAGDLWRDRLCGQPGPAQAAHHRVHLDVCHPDRGCWPPGRRVPAARRRAARQCVGWSHCGEPTGSFQRALDRAEGRLPVLWQPC